VIIPVYNAKEHIAKCINSVIYQTYKNIEIILVDDGSTDGSSQICENFASIDKRIKVIHQVNSGVSLSRNKGISISKGKYITFVDADDSISSMAIETMVSLIQKHKVDCVRTMYQIQGESFCTTDPKLKINTGKYSKKELSKMIMQFLYGVEPSYVCIWLFERKIIEKKYSFNVDIHMMEDTCFIADVLSRSNSVYVSDIRTYVYTINKNSATRSPKYYERNIYEVIKANSQIVNSLKNYGILNAKQIKQLNATHINIISNYVFLFYQANQCSKTRLFALLERLEENKDFSCIAKKSEIKSLPLRSRFSAKSICTKKYTRIIYIFRLRIFLISLKKVVGI
jgi:glycosyltransferase involved in cell wall biosynthesis